MRFGSPAQHAKLSIFVAERRNEGEKAYAWTTKLVVCNSFVASLTYSMLFPTLSLLVTETLSMPPHLAGFVFSAFAVMMLFNLLLPWYASLFNVHTILQMCFMFRFLAGILHMLLMIPVGFYTVPVLFTGRCLQGLGHLTLPLLQAFIGTQINTKDVPEVQAGYMQGLFLGLLFGPIVGSFLCALARFLPVETETAYAIGQTILPGLVQVFLAMFMSHLHFLKFSPRTVLGELGLPESTPELPILSICYGVVIQCISFASFMAFEVLLSLYLYQFFSMREEYASIPFATCVLFQLVAKKIYRFIGRSNSVSPQIWKFIVVLISSCPAMILVSWKDLDDVVSVFQFTVGFSLLGAAHFLIYTGVNVSLSLLVPTQGQVKMSAIKETVVFFIRSLGPVFILPIWSQGQQDPVSICGFSIFQDGISFGCAANHVFMLLSIAIFICSLMLMHMPGSLLG